MPFGEENGSAPPPKITLYRPERPCGVSIVICPGGAYGFHAVEPEGHGIARWLVPHGITGVVLEYRLPRGNPLVPLVDAQRAVRIVRCNARAWQCDPDRVGIMGFSAGGHLASTAGTHFDSGDAGAVDPIDRVSCRPDFMILIYPVITMGAKTNAGTRLNLLGPDPAPDTVELFSNERQVTSRTPPAFLAHALDDEAVAVDNSRELRDALRRNHVAAELLELPSGGHGLNGYQGPMWDAWQARSIAWLKEQGILPGA